MTSGQSYSLSLPLNPNCPDSATCATDRPHLLQEQARAFCVWEPRPTPRACPRVGCATARALSALSENWHRRHLLTLAVSHAAWAVHKISWLCAFQRRAPASLEIPTSPPPARRDLNRPIHASRSCSYLGLIDLYPSLAQWRKLTDCRE